MDKQEVTLGSGQLYIKEFEGSIPEDTALEVEGNRIGGISGGSRITAEPWVWSI